jgi:hypothetical protein
VLWWTKPKEVLNEIATVLGLEYADTNTPGWFNYRTTAIKNILTHMSEARKNKLKAEAETFAERGLPEEVQRK